MEIKLQQHEVVEAIEAFVQNKYGLTSSLNSFYDYPCFTYTKVQRPVKKHRNGYPLKDHNGNLIYDLNAETSYTTASLDFDETFELSFMLGEDDDH